MKWRYLAGCWFSFSLQYDFFYFCFWVHLLLCLSGSLYLSLSCVPCVYHHTHIHTQTHRLPLLPLVLCVHRHCGNERIGYKIQKYIHIFLINSASAFAKEETQHQTRFADVVRCLVANLLSKPYDKWTEKFSNYWHQRLLISLNLCHRFFFIFSLIFFLISLHACALCESPNVLLYWWW